MSPGRLIRVLTVAVALCLLQRSTPAAIGRLDLPGLTNVFSLGTNILSGSSPTTEDSFRALAARGVKTIISVDGALPDVERAAKHGLRYVHLPQGYNGIPTNAQALLAKAALTLPTPIYVHCHHGAHRGPTAAAILCVTREAWSPRESEIWLNVAGTSSNYPGLFEAVRNFSKPSDLTLSAIPANFPSRASVSTIVEAMVQIDDVFGNLKRLRKSNYQPPAQNPDLNFQNEALMLKEHYRELQRVSSIKSNAALLDSFAKAEAEAQALENASRAARVGVGVGVDLEKPFADVARRCVSCHRDFRDTAE